MAAHKRNLEDLSLASGPGTLSDLAKSAGKQKLRDPYVFFDYENTDGRYQIGYGIIYPGCKTGGHVHDEAEEIYHIIDGFGTMTVGDDTFDIAPGDTYIVPMHKTHFSACTSNTPLKLFWIVCRVK
jgi:mannose-6-phosphate isomerase-like protein (cupin superfamily)